MSMLLNQLGPYHLHEEINSYNGLLVYYATDTRTRQERLVYLLDPLAGLAATDIQRFVETVEAAQQLQHPNILTFYESGEVNGYQFAATQPLSGMPLAHDLRHHDTNLSVEVVNLIVQQVAAALDFAATKGFAHGALTPVEIWLDENGFVQVSGFGLLSVFGSPSALAASAEEHSADETVTHGGRSDLSPYMAPEQVELTGFSDRRTDVYSLCAVTYAVLVGRPPFPGDQRTLSQQIIHLPPAPPEQFRPDLPSLAGAILQFGLAKDPASRYATAGEFAGAFAQAQQVSLPAKPVVHTIKPSVFQNLLALSGTKPARYGLVIALPLLVIVLLAGTLLVSRSFSRALTSQTTPATAQGTVPSNVAVVETVSAAAPLEDSLTLPSDSPTNAEALATHVAPEIVDTPALAPTVDQRTSPPPTLPVPTAPPVADDSAAAGSLPAATPLQTEPAAEHETFVASDPDPSADSAAATGVTDTRSVSDAPIVVAQPLAPIVRIITDQIIQSVGALTITTPIQNAPVTDALTLTQPVANETGATGATSETENSPQAEPAQDAGLHLPLVMQDIYAEGAINQTANLRARPSTSAGIMGIARPGQRVTLVACNQDCSWYLLSTGEWVAAFLINLVADPAHPLPLATPSPPGD